MKPRVSAGLLLYRGSGRDLKFLLVHPGGPYFAPKDAGHWSIPKGEVESGDDLLATAIREVKEEVGIEVSPRAEFIPLGSIQQKGGKIVHAWAVTCPELLERASDGDDTLLVQSNTFEMEWPPGSGRRQSFPEVDQARFFDLEGAKQKVKPTQQPLLLRLAELLSGRL